MSKRLQIVYSEHSLSIVITISSNCWKFYLLCIVSQEHLVLFHCSIVWPCDGKTRPSTISKHQNYLTNCTVAMLFNHHFYPQNGICIQKCNFWPKNVGEKWSRKIYFEIPPCGKIVIFITEFVFWGTFMK